jgi:hypothetical protein
VINSISPWSLVLIIRTNESDISWNTEGLLRGLSALL